MNFTSRGAVLVAAVHLIVGCATNMTPSEFNESLPKATGAQFYDRVSLGPAIAEGQRRLLVADRKYTAPVGMTVSGDVENAALGIDEWVNADGGNAYSLANYEWIHLPDEDGTQLIVYFDTLRCK